jgi:4-amino-4-deoxy-L-arabinose transferase-like glycosyltransferase
MLHGVPPPPALPAAMHAAPGTDAPAGAATRWLLALAAYLGAQVLARLWTGAALELDEAEQVLWTQRLALGYGAQPPLYTWLQRGVFEILGVSVLGLTLLKNGLLALTYLFTFAAARTLVPTSLAALASASMLLIPQIGWESQRDLTHSVVCTTMAAATWWAVLALRQRATPTRYAALGLALGLGVLGKYNFAGFALALLLALVAAENTRPLVMQRGMALAVAVAALIVAPHALWLLSNLAQATGGTLDKMGATATLPWGEGVLRGLGRLGLVVVAFLTPLWIVLLALFVRRGWREGVVPGPGCGLLRRYLVIVAALLLALVLVGGVTHFKGRWLQPFLFIAPVAFFACAPHLQRHPRLPAYRRLLALWAVLLVVLMALRAPLDGWRGDPDEMNLPAPALVQALRDAGYDGRPIVSTNRVLGGVLRLHFAPASVIVVGRGRGREPLPDGVALWIGPGDGPDALAAIESVAGRPASAPRTVALPPAHAPASAMPMRYTFSLQP